MLRLKWSIVLLFLFIFEGNAVAQQIQMVPVTPAYQSPAGPIPSVPYVQGQQPIPQLQPQPVQPAPSQQAVQPQPSTPEAAVPVAAPPAPPQPSIEELSEFEQYISGKFPLAVSLNIGQFGYSLFRKPPSTFAPVEKVPVGPDYVLGPSDEIRITVWGKIEGQWNVVVDRDGNITLPKIGILGVTGLTFKEMKELLLKEFSKYYKGFEMNLSMGALRTIRVYVVGSAERPGAYTVSSLSTLINALFEAGGPSKTGTMRDIQVKRNGKTIVNFDMYDFLLMGDKTKDVRLMPEDVIFIPPVGPLAAIAGNVKRPAIYELKGETRITYLIAMAGGITATGYLQRIQIERIYQNEVKIIVDTNLKDLDKEKDIVLKDADLVKIFPIIDMVINAVKLKGNVTRPGQYQWFEGIKVSDIIKDPEKDLLPESYFEHALIERYIPPDYHREIISLDLRKAVFDKDTSEDKLLQPYDTLTIYLKWDFIERPIVRITGAVNKPDNFELRKNMKISDLIKLAGGPKYYAFLKEAELTRVTPTPEGPKTEKIMVNLEKALSGEPTSDIYLKQNDYLFVRTVPEWDLYKTITVSGEVKFPGTYTIKKGETLYSLLERAGGYTDKAYLRGAIFIRERVKELQQKSLEEMILRLERELLSESSVSVSTALSQEEVQAKKIEMEQKQKFIESLKKLKATGRMTIRLAHPRLLKGSEYDIELEDGDTLYITMKNNVVNVVGAVLSQGSFIYQDKLNYKDYIEMSGRYSRYADTDNVYVLKVDGSARRLAKGFINWNPFKYRWEMTAFGEEIKEIEPGDTIVVPEKLERIAWLREIKDITQILMQMAVTAGVVVNLF
jgi:protein involved in polysaccharide export with SLBB domain